MAEYKEATEYVHYSFIRDFPPSKEMEKTVKGVGVIVMYLFCMSWQRDFVSSDISKGKFLDSETHVSQREN